MYRHRTHRNPPNCSWPVGFQETIPGLLGPAPNPNHAIHPGQGQKTRPCPRLPKPPTPRHSAQELEEEGGSGNFSTS